MVNGYHHFMYPLLKMDPDGSCDFSLGHDDINLVFDSLPTKNEAETTNSSWDEGIGDDEIHDIFESRHKRILLIQLAILHKNGLAVPRNAQPITSQDLLV